MPTERTLTLILTLILTVTLTLTLIGGQDESLCLWG